MPSNIERQSLKGSTVEFQRYPNIFEINYHNYLFQSLAVPENVETKEHFDELRQYAQFRVFTRLPESQIVDEKTRTVYSLALRLLNRGIVMRANEKTEKKINRFFGKSNSQSHLSSMNTYIQYKTPKNPYRNLREQKFAEYYFPKVFGEAWATYVYVQFPSNLLLPNHQLYSTDDRVDFLVCFGDKTIIIELDDEDYPLKKSAIITRDWNLAEQGYPVKHFASEDIDTKSETILNELKEFFAPSLQSAPSPYNKKHLVSCKVVHQVSIAIVKMLEEGHLPQKCHLNLVIDSAYFTSQEQNLLLLFAVEEVSELVENFAKLYDAEIHLDLFDENAENLTIMIGDGDDGRRSIIIRDVVLPMNYLCSILPFADINPVQGAITEELLSYFLFYIFGHSLFKPGQFLAIRRVLCKEDSIILLPTGSGKSVIYQLSSMLLPGITVVISPLRALITDQISNLSDKGIHNVASIFSDERNNNAKMLTKAKAIMENHSATMLYIAPERLQIPTFRKEILSLLDTNRFCLVAIDEAHCVSEWGHEFRASYLQIGRSCRNLFGNPPLVALTGTASDNVLKDVKRDLEINSPDALITPATFDRPELRYSVIPCAVDEKVEQIKRLLTNSIPKRFKSSPGEFHKIRGSETASGLIFTTLAAPKRKGNFDAWSLYQNLKQYPVHKGLNIGTYFSRVPSALNGKEWPDIIACYARRFKDNQCQLLVATKAFGMGIDKPNIRYVIHNSMPNSIEQYYQEVGRAGRDGAHSECFLLFSNGNDKLNEAMLNPNLEWVDFYKHTEKSNNGRDDVSSLVYFHKNNFMGVMYEKDLIFVILKHLRSESNDFTEFKEGKAVSVTLNSLYITITNTPNRYSAAKEKLSKKYDSSYSSDSTESFPSVPHPSQKGSALEELNNDLAKAIIRLVTLGILEDYEYDYTRQQYNLVLGQIQREKVREKYLTFVECNSRGKIASERKRLEDITGDDLHFIKEIIDSYVDLVYGTIEKGRRRAMHSMFRLAKDASEIPNRQKQDAFIRNEIQNYLIKDETVDLVKNSLTSAGLDEILRAYPLYPSDVIIDRIEVENAKKTNGYAARVLESDPYHPGLLYLHAITSVKSDRYQNEDVVNDIVTAYQNSSKYSIPQQESLAFFVKTMNLTYHASSELFELLWEKTEKTEYNDILAKAFELGEEDISPDFQEYLLLHATTWSLHKMIGDYKL